MDVSFVVVRFHLFVINCPSPVSLMLSPSSVLGPRLRSIGETELVRIKDGKTAFYFFGGDLLLRVSSYCYSIGDVNMEMSRNQLKSQNKSFRGFRNWGGSVSHLPMFHSF